MLDIFLLVLAGLVGGFLSGLLGIGGGVIYIMILPFVLGNEGVSSDHVVRFTVANSIFGTLVASLSGNISQIRYKNFFLKEVLVVGFSATIVSLVTLRYVVHSRWYSSEIFNWIVIIILAYMLISTLYNSKRAVSAALEVKDNFKLGLAGFSGGLIASLSGLGGGIVVVPVLSSILKMDIKKAKSISLGVILISALFMTTFNIFFDEGITMVPFHHYGFIIPLIVVPLSVGVVVGAPYGVKVSRKMSSYLITIVFSIFIGLVILSRIFNFFV